jgi:tocopherol cyclase
MYLKKIKHPEFFQGNKKTNHYFEGWYYKLVTEDQKTSLALIPGISMHQQDPHAFIQVFISTDLDLKTHYFRFKSDAFIYSYEQFIVQIEKNLFSLKSLELNLLDGDMNLSGTIKFNNHKTLKKNIYQPNIMGPFAYIPFMECNHGVISMQSNLEGMIHVNGKDIDFSKGKAYIEKDWGKSFPKSYIWLQSNHFKDDQTSLMFSYATIPFMGLSFKGLIVNLLIQEKEYRFATYNFTKILSKEIKKDEISFLLKHGKYKLEIYAKKENDVELKSPSFGLMNQTIKEGLSGIIRIKFYEKDVLIYEDQGQNAGIEIMM